MGIKALKVKIDQRAQPNSIPLCHYRRLCPTGFTKQETQSKDPYSPLIKPGVHIMAPLQPFLGHFIFTRPYQEDHLFTGPRCTNTNYSNSLWHDIPKGSLPYLFWHNWQHATNIHHMHWSEHTASQTHQMQGTSQIQGTNRKKNTSGTNGPPGNYPHHPTNQMGLIPYLPPKPSGTMCICLYPCGFNKAIIREHKDPT